MSSFIRKVKRNIAVKESGLSRRQYFKRYHDEKSAIQKELELKETQKQSLFSKLKSKVFKRKKEKPFKDLYPNIYKGE